MRAVGVEMHDHRVGMYFATYFWQAPSGQRFIRMVYAVSARDQSIRGASPQSNSRS